MTNILKTTKAKFEALPDKKKYLEFISAFLSVPVLITVALLNFNNLKKTKQPENSSQPTPQIETQVPTVQITREACKEEIGPIEIVFPSENQTATDNPLCLEINYKDKTYCPVVWSYRLNSSKWSDFTDKSICIYNLESGDKKLDLKVKSLAGGEELILTREFTYKNGEFVPTLTQTQLPSPTPTVLPTIEPSLAPSPTSASPSGALQ